MNCFPITRRRTVRPRRDFVGRLVLLAAVLASFSPVEGWARADTLGRKIDAIFADVSDPAGPGCAVGVATQDGLIFQRGYGSANLDDGIPIGPDTVFDIASTSKQFTAASIALLAQSGKVDLDGDIHRYLPDLPTYGKTVTVRHLLTHTGGIPDPYAVVEALTGDEDGNFYPSELTLQLLRKMDKLEFEPGTKFEYSNAGYLLLAEIVERVSGQSLRKFAEQNIFAPLGMTHTHFHDDHREIVKHRAHGYSKRDDGSWAVKDSNFYVVGDGGVYTTVADLAVWNANFSDNKLPGGQALIKLMEMPATYLDGRPKAGGSLAGIDFDYSLGLIQWRYNENRVIGHLGGWAGFASGVARFPDRKFTVIALCNFRTQTVLKRMHQVADAVLTLEKGGAGGTHGPNDPMRGVYGNTIVVTMPDGNELKVYYNEDRTYSYSNGDSGAWFINKDGKLCLPDPKSGVESPAQCDPILPNLGVGSEWDKTMGSGAKLHIRVVEGRSP